MTLKKCSSATERHSWQFVRNRTVYTRTICKASFSLKGVYRCKVCGLFKYGQPSNLADAQGAMTI